MSTIDLTQEKIVIASHNQGKVREITDLLAPYGLSFTSAADLSLEEPEETGQTFEDNAILKARAAAEASGLVALADDSGLAVNALGGDPGIYSARWAGPDKDFNLAMQKVEEGLNGQTDRGAAFICVLALAWPDGRTQTFEGRIEGDLIWPPRGDRGFGYDPIFVPKGYDKTFAELDYSLKQSISHRAQAFEKFKENIISNSIKKHADNAA